MPAKQTIYVDMDDVLCETARALLAIVEREFGKTILYDQLNTFEVGEACGLQNHEVTELFRIAHHPEELLGMAPIKEALSVLRQWSEAGHEIAIVTGRPPSTHESSIEWLAVHGLPYDTFIMVDKYGRFTAEDAAGRKLSDLAGRRFSFAVEDSPTMAKYLADEMKVPVALLDRPWNRATAEHSLISRYNHWREIGESLPARSKR
jgi:uncharacterized HAD superfamily protein